MKAQTLIMFLPATMDRELFCVLGFRRDQRMWLGCQVDFRLRLQLEQDGL